MPTKKPEEGPEKRTPTQVLLTLGSSSEPCLLGPWGRHRLYGF